MNKKTMKQKVAGQFAALVCGRKIVSCSYHDDGEASFPVLELSDGSCILIQSDDECNAAGVPVCFSKEEDRGVGMWQVWSDLGS
jgi:hypothetical protein